VKGDIGIIELTLTLSATRAKDRKSALLPLLWDADEAAVHSRDPSSGVDYGGVLGCNEALTNSSVNQSFTLFDQHIYGWRHGQEKINSVRSGAQEAWFPEDAHIKTLAQFLREKIKHPGDHRVGLFATFTKTWVGMTTEEQQQIEMHVWVGMVLTARAGQENGSTW
jgi:hypothetical protein